MEKYEKFIKMAIELGASDARIIEMDGIVTAAWVEWKCRYGCPLYNSTLRCPPNTPTYRETRELVDCYKYALLVQFKEDADNAIENQPDSTLVLAKLQRATTVTAKLEQDIFLAGYHKAFALGAGPCTLCPECTRKECRHPKSSRPSMESCGIDVFSTVRNHGYHIEILKDQPQQMNLFGLVFIE